MDHSTTEQVNPLHAAYDGTPEQKELLEKVGTIQDIVEKTTGAETFEQVLRVAGAVTSAVGVNPTSPVETLVDDALRILGVPV